ncbi:hypothetical protein CHLRE_03g199087v5 [Chlamydomonas reinhardtii]|uniref:Uncharacterized protein n=1 Tax=Chlamydomonas reinhardtii TaxID=3055 RepID=A0A2K3DZI4_CHLRE|nr:uncharacterized protein CHLRE_03g199087v5 [Chlamydomonas reinhardtii]PNW85952.1 hypothetical protein CHLRE_03g199087v5 [Chlamydomonas reinhardtii]
MTRLQAQFNRNGSNYFEKAEGDQHEKKAGAWSEDKTIPIPPPALSAEMEAELRRVHAEEEAAQARADKARAEGEAAQAGSSHTSSGERPPSSSAAAPAAVATAAPPLEQPGPSRKREREPTADEQDDLKYYQFKSMWRDLDTPHKRRFVASVMGAGSPMEKLAPSPPPPQPPQLPQPPQPPPQLPQPQQQPQQPQQPPTQHEPQPTEASGGGGCSGITGAAPAAATAPSLGSGGSVSPEALAASAGVSSRCAGGSLRCSGSATNLLQTQQQGLGVAAGFAAAGGNPMAAGLHGSQPLSPGLSQQAPPQQREEEGEEEASGGEGKEEGGRGDEAAACLPPPQVLLPPPPLPLDPSSQLFEGSMSQAEVADAADVFYDLKHEAAAAEEKEEEAAAEEGGTAATEATEEGGETTAAAAAAAAAPGAVEPSFPRLVESQHIDAALNPGENNVGGGETITGTGFYGTINAACTMQIFLVLFGILSGAFAWPVMFDAGVGLGRPLVAAFTRGLCAYAYGNDSCPSRVDKAIKFMRMFVEFIKGKGVNVTAQFLARRPAVFAMTMEDMAKVPQGLEGVTHVFTFWQGIPASAKDALGAMFAASSTTVGIAVVDKGAGVLMERQLGQHGFGPLELVKQFAVRMYGSNSQKQVWVFKKPGAVYRELPEEKLVDYAPYVHQPHLPVPPRIEWMHALYQAALAEEARKYKLSVAEGKGERDRRPPQRFGFS